MSEIRANTVSNAAGTGPVTLTGQYAEKAWLNYKGTATNTVRASANISSVTDNGTGDYTFNFTNSFSDANYAASFLTKDRVALCGIVSSGMLTSSCRIQFNDSRNATYTDQDTATVKWLGDLA